MTLFDARLPERKRSILAGAALKTAAFAALVTAYSALLIRTRAVEASAGFAAFLAGLALAALALPLAVAALVAVWRTGRRGGVRAMVAIVLSALTLAGPAYVAGKGLRAPFLTDVATDPADPPRFDRATRDRSSGDLPTPTGPLAAAQAASLRAAYPELAPLHLSLPADEVANLAIGLVEERGWRVLGATAFARGGPPTGRIEAVARSRILGFDDDVSIRVRAEGDGSRVDMRSASRLGPTDFGGNAARIKAFLADLSTAANGAP